MNKIPLRPAIIFLYRRRRPQKTALPQNLWVDFTRGSRGGDCVFRGIAGQINDFLWIGKEPLAEPEWRANGGAFRRPRKDGTLVIVEYKMGKMASDRAELHKKAVGELWAARSGGRARFAWIVDKNWQTLQERLA